MTEQELAEIYAELVDILKDSGFARVVEYAEGTRDEEKEDIKYPQDEVQNAYNMEMENLENSNAQQEPFSGFGLLPSMVLLNPPSQKSLSVSEQKLRRLIAIFEYTLTHPAEMAHEFSAFFYRHAHVNTINFAPSFPTQGREFELEYDQIQSHMQLIRRLKELLHQLMEDTDHEDI